MNLDFLTDDLLIKTNNFNGPVVVTGAGGCIGSWIRAILHRSKIPCVGIDLSPKKDRLELILGNQTSQVKWEVCDITNLKLLKHSFQSARLARVISLVHVVVQAVDAPLAVVAVAAPFPSI